MSLIALLSIALFACVSDKSPRDPVWGKQACDACRMLIDDPRFAAQLLERNGERRFFDDVGCLDEYAREHPDTSEALWVRLDEHWVDAARTRYSAGARSPMDYGFVPSRDGALDFASVRNAAAEKRAKGRR